MATYRIIKGTINLNESFFEKYIFKEYSKLTAKLDFVDFCLQLGQLKQERTFKLNRLHAGPFILFCFTYSPFQLC